MASKRAKIQEQLKTAMSSLGHAAAILEECGFTAQAGLLDDAADKIEDVEGSLNELG